jgi:predicted nucleic acid-binding protein
MTGAKDSAEIREWTATANKFDKLDRLLVPNNEDWVQAGKILNSILRGLKSKAGGRTPRLPFAEKQRMIRDVLIARTVKRAGAALVTDNIKDFEAIRSYCRVRLISGREYFKTSPTQ